MATRKKSKKKAKAQKRKPKRTRVAARRVPPTVVETTGTAPGTAG